jgi:hypothetical protein
LNDDTELVLVFVLFWMFNCFFSISKVLLRQMQEIFY